MWLYMRLTTMVTLVKGDDAYMMAALHHYDEGNLARAHVELCCYRDAMLTGYSGLRSHEPI